MSDYKYDVCIIGGLGHIGLPLGVVMASKGMTVCLYDINEEVAEVVRRGEMPFVEYGAVPLLKEALKQNQLDISLDVSCIADAKYVVIAIGTPVDEYLNPQTRKFLEFIKEIKPYLHTEQIIIVRSSVFPRTCEQILNELGSEETWHLTYCPERIVQGYMVEELEKLPQIVAGYTDHGIKEASALFSQLTSTVIEASMNEAELVKLFSNSWRYIQFAVANQFYMICDDFDVDYDRVRSVMVEGYDRAKGLPSAGFAAGPCLLKDTMQLSAFYNNNFLFGHTAMMVNEGLPNYLVSKISQRHGLKEKKIGILGMAFKADIDDIRDSLSYKLGKVLRFRGANVYYSDEFVKDPTFVSKEELLEQCDIVIVAVPHSNYKGLVCPKGVEVVDTWGLLDHSE